MKADNYYLTDYDLHLLTEGTHLRSYEKLGAHPISLNGESGVNFAVWAPNASAVSVIGDHNEWQPGASPLRSRGDSGVWEGFIPRISAGAHYKYYIESKQRGFTAEKADPYGFYAEVRPKSASIVFDLNTYSWNDGGWMARRGDRNALARPISVYEVHLGSWRRKGETRRWLTYRELAEELPGYVRDLGYTHVEFLPVMEHPFDGSWGYQTIGYFAPTSRFGTPHDFMALIDALHQNDIGVILDWTPAHFPRDGHGLAFFDGTHLYEHSDPREGAHADWGTLIFNYGRREVANFLLSNAMFWLDKYHIDGLRVDAVASMIYRDYSRKPGEWIPNKYGGRENLEAIDFLKRLNETAYGAFGNILMVAEESTAWPMVSRPTYVGGLGFGLKWNMGWMNDVLRYISHEPVHRSFHHNLLTFGLLYAFHENFVLPFSHDEVVHGKAAMLSKIPGDDWQKCATLRSLYGFMYGHPGKKLLFMGGEFGQRREWAFDESLDWHLLDYPMHKGLQLWVRDLNRLLREEPALHKRDFEEGGFSWIDCNDSSQSTLSFLRHGDSGDRKILCVCNFTPVVREEFVLGVPFGGVWTELLNSDAEIYGGSGQGNAGAVYAAEDPAVPAHGMPYSLKLRLPPLGTLFLRSP